MTIRSLTATFQALCVGASLFVLVAVPLEGQTGTITGTVVADTTGGQILIDNITTIAGDIDPVVVRSGDTWISGGNT